MDMNFNAAILLGYKNPPTNAKKLLSQLDKIITRRVDPEQTYFTTNVYGKSEFVYYQTHGVYHADTLIIVKQTRESRYRLNDPFNEVGNTYSPSVYFSGFCSKINGSSNWSKSYEEQLREVYNDGWNDAFELISTNRIINSTLFRFHVRSL